MNDLRASTSIGVLPRALACGALALAACMPMPPAPPPADAALDAPAPIDAAPDAPGEGCPVVTTEPERHSDTVTADQTWGPGVHLIVSDVSVRTGATLTIAPCAVVRLLRDRGLYVYAGGTLVAEGAATQPIRFERAEPEFPYLGLQVSAGRARLAYVTIDGGGEQSNDPVSAALRLRGDAQTREAQPLVRVAHVTVRGAAKIGVRAEENATFTADSEDLTVTGAGQFPVLAAPNSVTSLPPGRYTGNGADEVLVPDGAVEWDATLGDRGVPYHIGRIGSRNTSLRVTRMNGPAPLLTIAAGVVLRFEPAAVMEVEHYTGTMPATGALRVEGTAERPVVFTSAAATPAPGDWVGLWFGGRPDPRNRVAHARFEYAGGLTGALNHSCDNPAAPAMMTARNRAAILVMGEPPGSFITDTTIVDSAADGIERGWFGAPVELAAGNTFTRVAWCQQSYPRPPSGPCPDPVPCTRAP